jgi:predicted nucleic acid-binding Zn ribbon protein
LSKFERYKGKGEKSIYPHKHCERCGNMIKESYTYCPDCYEIIKEKEQKKGIIKKIKSFFSRKK